MTLEPQKKLKAFLFNQLLNTLTTLSKKKNCRMRYFQNTFVSQGTFMIGEAILINNSMPLKKKKSSQHSLRQGPSWAHLASFSLKSSRMRFFLKNLAPSFISRHLNVKLKIRILLKAILKKTSVQINKLKKQQMGILLDLYFVGYVYMHL